MSIFSFLKKDHIQEWQPVVEQINSLEKGLETLTADELKAKTEGFKERVQRGESLDSLLVDAFAVVRQAAKQTIKQRHYDVQLLGGIGLHKGMVVEMMTGEGKTLVATLPTYLNALEGRGAHVVTVNDYLAQRDAVWMGQIYQALGLTVGCIVHDASYQYDPSYLPPAQAPEIEAEQDALGVFRVHHEFLKPISRAEAYACDVLYGTNHEFGFDYLRDNLVQRPEDLVQRELHYAIIDEVDSILIDEARTPLIISSYAREAENVYQLFDVLAKRLQAETHFTIDEKRKTVFLTEEGQTEVEKLLGFNPYLIGDLHATHHLEEALKANVLFHKDKDYIIKDKQVVIVDEFTGRLMWGRRWSGGLHQAVEAKERVPVQPESKTVASITIQNLFKRYAKRAGMTGTARTSAEEFSKVYGMEVVAIPSNKVSIRLDQPDRIFVTPEAKWQALVSQVKSLAEQGRPVLIGTTSIEKNELVSKLLKEHNIPHQVLNAKNHEEEGQIIAQAGKLNTITVATNMAGRGVDILLGGNPADSVAAEKIKTLGGLCVIGTERHEARRIDNQLRGRAGRQGDPGETIFYLSLEDDLIRVFGGETIKNLITRFNLPQDQAIEHKMISRSIEEAQSKIEGFNFDTRKHLVEYDDIINAQREKIYAARRAILSEDKNPSEVLEEAVSSFLEDEPQAVQTVLGIKADDSPKEKIDSLLTALKESTGEKYPLLIKQALLSTYDYLWAEHLSYLDEVKDSVGYRAYGQRDPLIEFKREAFETFETFQRIFRFHVIQYLINIQKQETQSSPLDKTRGFGGQAGGKGQVGAPTGAKVGRNDPCPCGAKKDDGTPIKYKHCHGR